VTEEIVWVKLAAAVEGAHRIEPVVGSGRRVTPPEALRQCFAVISRRFLPQPRPEGWPTSCPRPHRRPPTAARARAQGLAKAFRHSSSEPSDQGSTNSPKRITTSTGSVSPTAVRGRRRNSTRSSRASTRSRRPTCWKPSRSCRG
jgi:hypothetical protein